MATIHGLREIVRNFQSQCNLERGERTFILQRAVAGAIAYSAICPVGPLEEAGGYYNSVVRNHADAIIEEINNIHLCSPLEISKMVREIWMMRYNIVNCPMFIVDFVAHKNAMTMYREKDLTDAYNNWVVVVSKTIQELIRGE